jgi:UDP-GlcNAc:undecaprenyl-phosphate GlcNAc-1-phosphate transferase
MNNFIILYIILTFLILYLNGIISYKLNLIDRPNKRKIHFKATSYIGGISISIILLFALKLFDVESKDLNLILSIGFLISLIGFIDDKYNLKANIKLSLQLIPVSYLIFFENLNLMHLGDYSYFKLDLGAFSIPFTILSVLLLINAFNYFDGMDGLLSCTTISSLAFIYFLVSEKNVELFLITVFIPITIFLFFNFSIFKLPKQFLGDSGSLLLGFILSFLLIYLAKQKIVHPILLAWTISIFIYEFISINIIRLKNRKPLFMPTKDHLHHVLFIKTKSVIKTNFFIFMINILFFSIGYFSFIFINSITSFFLFIVIFLIFLILRLKYFIIR